MRSLIGFGLLVIALLLTGCDSPYIERKELLAVQVQLAQSQQQLKETEQRLEETKKALQQAELHRYQIFQQSYRTWRLDTTNGDVCLLLATDQDWKNQKVNAQGCSAIDLARFRSMR